MEDTMVLGMGNGTREGYHHGGGSSIPSVPVYSIVKEVVSIACTEFT